MDTIEGEWLVVRAVLDDAAVLDHHDLLGIANALREYRESARGQGRFAGAFSLVDICTSVRPTKPTTGTR